MSTLMRILALAMGASAPASLAGAVDRIPAPPPDVASIQLPTGSLTGVAGGRASVTFLDEGRSTKAGNQADVWTLTIYEPGIPVSGSASVMSVTHLTIDCAARTYAELGDREFNEAGEMVMWTPAFPAMPIEKNNAKDFVARVICDGQRPPNNITVNGHAEALKLGRAILRVTPKAGA